MSSISKPNINFSIRIDDKKSTGWVLHSEQSNDGILIEHIMHKGEPIPLEFSSLTSSTTPSFKNKNNSSPNGSYGASGIIEATFWRVMKIENSGTYHNSSKRHKSEENDLHVNRRGSFEEHNENDENYHSGIEYIPDGRLLF